MVTIMSHEVFISYSSIDKQVADQVCDKLETSGTDTWIAPRDVMPGKPYGEALIDAINDSKVMVLVLSEHSNHSTQVVREVERAASKGIPIIPFRIAEVRLAKSLEYFLSTCHWLDAFGGDVEKHLPRLVEAVNATLRAVYDGETLALDPSLESHDHRRAKPAAPKTRSSRAAILAQPADESVYTAELVSSHQRDHRHDHQRDRRPSPPQRESNRGPYASPRHGGPAYAYQAKPPRTSNALGIAGLTTSIIGILTCGAFSPIGLLLSMIGLFKAPRGNAVAGSLLGGLGSLMFSAFFIYGFFSGFTTAIELEDAAAHIDGYYYNAGDYPSPEEAESLLYGHEDAWGQPLRYERRWPDGFEVRSAGLDGAFDTSDDHALVR
jgi:hypothetical protein